MTNTKHTPGPWTVLNSLIAAGKHESIVQFGFNIRENPQAYANARLIAAAPDLLEACIALLEKAGVHSVHCTKDFTDPDAFIKALNAINKAKGELQ